MAEIHRWRVRKNLLGTECARHEDFVKRLGIGSLSHIRWIYYGADGKSKPIISSIYEETGPKKGHWWIPIEEANELLDLKKSTGARTISEFRRFIVEADLITKYGPPRRVPLNTPPTPPLPLPEPEIQDDLVDQMTGFQRSMFRKFLLTLASHLGMMREEALAFEQSLRGPHATKRRSVSNAGTSQRSQQRTEQ